MHVPTESHAPCLWPLLERNDECRNQCGTQTWGCHRQGTSQQQRNDALGFGVYIGTMHCCASVFHSAHKLATGVNFKFTAITCAIVITLSLAASEGSASDWNPEFLVLEHCCCDARVNKLCASFFRILWAFLSMQQQKCITHTELALSHGTPQRPFIKRWL